MSKKLQVLERFGHKGQFVKYPAKWPHRMVHTGKRRFDTHCDLLVGMCACGERHLESDDWVQCELDQHNATIETHAEWLARTRSEKS